MYITIADVRMILSPDYPEYAKMCFPKEALQYKLQYINILFYICKACNISCFIKSVEKL